MSGEIKSTLSREVLWRKFLDTDTGIKRVNLLQSFIVCRIMTSIFGWRRGFGHVKRPSSNLKSSR